MSTVNCDLVIQLFKEPKLAASLSLEQWQRIILILRHHQLLARYADRFSALGLFEKLPEYCQHHFNNALIIARNQSVQVFFEARELVKNIGEDVESLIFLKGAGYTLSRHPVGQSRIYNDIDVLVDKQSLKKLEQKLFFLGWVAETLSDYDERYYRKWSHEIPPLRHSQRGTVIDVHHNIVPLISGRAPNVSALRSQKLMSLDGYSTLSQSAMTLHSTVHLFFNEDMTKGYRDLIDLHILMSECVSHTYWTDLIELAKETNFERELYLACRYTSIMFGTVIPEIVSLSLKPVSAIKLRILDFMFMRILTPAHPYAKPRFYALAEFMVLIRGHYLKMPLPILAYHLCSKSLVSLTQFLFGKHVFEKELDKR